MVLHLGEQHRQRHLAGFADLTVNGEAKDTSDFFDIGIYESHLPAGKKSVFYVSWFQDPAALEEVSFRLSVMDFSAETVLSTTENAITLSPEIN